MISFNVSVKSWLTLLVVLLMSLNLNSSSFSLPSYLNSLLNDGQYNQSQLSLARAMQLESALYYDIENNPLFSIAWLKSAKILARKDKSLAWQLHLYYRQRQNGWTNKRDTVYWQQQALRLGAWQAIVAYAYELSEQGEYEQAQSLLNEIDIQHAANSKAILAIDNGDITLLNELFKRKTILKYLDVELINAIKKFKILESDSTEISKHLLSTTSKNSAQCLYPIQLFATKVAHLKQLEQKILGIQAQPLFSRAFCFQPIKYINPKRFSCSHTPSSRIDCDIEQLANHSSADTRYIGLVAPKGAANVNNGVLFIDSDDTQQVIEHELLHLLGFIDEYPLPELHSACDNTGAIALNVVNLEHKQFSSDKHARDYVSKFVPWIDLIDKGTPITHKSNEGLSLGTPSNFKQNIGLFKAKTCERHPNTSTTAFKPLSRTTKLQYFEVSISANYEEIFLQHQHKNDFLMPSYHYKIGLKYKLMNKEKQANIWFEKSMLADSR